MVERDKAGIEELSGQLDCGFVHGDGSTPAILKKTNPKLADLLFCLTGNDQANNITSPVGRSLGFARAVTKIESGELEPGLKDTIPARTIGRYRADMVGGQDLLELSAMIKDEARVYSFVAREEGAGPLSDLELPEQCRVIRFYRDGQFNLPQEDTLLKGGDEVVVLLHDRHPAEIVERWTTRSSSA